MAIGTPRWIQYNESTSGVGTGTDVFNRPSRDIWDTFQVGHEKTGAHKSSLTTDIWGYEEGTYTGNNTDDRNISLTDTNLDIKFIRIWCDRTGSPYSWVRTENIAGDNAAAAFGAGTFTADMIQSVGTGTFQIGNGGLNNNAQDYFYICYGPTS